MESERKARRAGNKATGERLMADAERAPPDQKEELLKLANDAFQKVRTLHFTWGWSYFTFP